MKILHIESAYENPIVTLGTQLCIPHLTEMTSPEIRHYEIKHLWIHPLMLFLYILFDFTFLLLLLKLYSG